MSFGREAAFPLGSRLTPEDLAADPHRHLAELRGTEPVSWVPALDGWLVTGYELATTVMRDADTFTVDDPRFSTAQVIGPSMLSLDGGEHRRHRGPFVDPFRSAEVRRRFGDWSTAEAHRLLDEFVALGAADLRSAFAAPLAVAVVKQALGLEEVATAELLGWYDAIVSAVEMITEGQPVPTSGAAAFDELGSAIEGSLDSFPDSLLASVDDEGTLTRSELVSNAAVLLFGGIVTSEGTAAAAFSHLLGDDEQLTLVLEDDSLVANAVEETLRLEPAAAVVDRYATRDVSLGEATIAAADLVRISLAGANRDPAMFAEPHRFDVQRDNAAQHLAFARGPHLCLGIHLARLEARVAVAAVLSRLPGLRLDPARSAPIRGLIFRAPETVWATWDAARAG